jgi:hypothetical protein
MNHSLQKAVLRRSQDGNFFNHGAGEKLEPSFENLKKNFITQWFKDILVCRPSCIFKESRQFRPSACSAAHRRLERAHPDSWYRRPSHFGQGAVGWLVGHTAEAGLKRVMG